VPALMLANLEVSRARRQLDFLIATPFRTLQCELKGFHWPVIGTANGLWVQIAPDGERRTLDTNPSRQAKEITYALSDEMKRFARKADAPRPEHGSFYRGIDAVVCVFPEIPAGSEIDPHPHVTVLGYQDLLARLAMEGPRLPWEKEHWQAFIRHLGLYRPEDQRPQARQAREQRAIVDDYAPTPRPRPHARLTPATERVREPRCLQAHLSGATGVPPDTYRPVRSKSACSRVSGTG
jgi:Nuclease-related domain